MDNPNTPVPVWTTKLGEKIPISEMADGHLRNTIFFLSRQHAVAQFRYSQAQFLYGVGSEVKPVPTDPWDWKPIYRDLCNEATRRGLSWFPETVPSSG